MLGIEARLGPGSPLVGGRRARRHLGQQRLFEDLLGRVCSSGRAVGSVYTLALALGMRTFRSDSDLS